MAEFVSISHMIKKAQVRYGRALLLTESDDNDLTYFMIYHLEILKKAVVELHEYIKRKSQHLRKLERELSGMAFLNHRQQALIGHALRHPDHHYTVDSHQRSHKVSYETARQDLLDLQKKDLLAGMKRGQTWYFSPRNDLERRLMDGPT